MIINWYFLAAYHARAESEFWILDQLTKSFTNSQAYAPADANRATTPIN
jgi:hypothetical protein